MAERNPVPLSDAHAAAVRCAKAVDAAHAQGYDVLIFASHGSVPERESLVELEACRQEAFDAGQRAKELVEPWKLEFAGVAEGVIEVEGASASSMHWGMVLAAERWGAMPWDAEEVREYFLALDGKPTETIDWQSFDRAPEDDLRGLDYCRFESRRLGLWIAVLEREYALASSSARIPPVAEPDSTDQEERVLRALRTSGKASMTGDEIALAMGVQPGGGGVKGTLARMVKSGQLLNQRGVGYWENPDHATD